MFLSLILEGVVLFPLLIMIFTLEFLTQSLVSAQDDY